jgi:DNA-binding CsgD family transcriptional regulator
MFTHADLGSDEWLERLTQLARLLGRKSFEHELVELLNLVLPVDHCVVFTHSPDGVGHLFTHGKMPVDTAQRLADDYVRQFHSRDPLFSKLLDAELTGLDRPTPLDLKATYDPAYLNHFFDRHELVDKASTIGRIEHQAVLCNFYRMRDSGPYSPDDRRRLERMLPLLTAFISAHYQMVTGAPGEASEESGGGRTRSLVHTIVGKRRPPFDRLTPREREVCERILLGYTSIGIGLDLSIALSSVLTYRKRAYEKLGISSQNELFALALAGARHR